MFKFKKWKRINKNYLKICPTIFPFYITSFILFINVCGFTAFYSTLSYRSISLVFLSETPFLVSVEPLLSLRLFLYYTLFT